MQKYKWKQKQNDTKQVDAEKWKQNQIRSERMEGIGKRLAAGHLIAAAARQ